MNASLSEGDVPAVTAVVVNEAARTGVGELSGETDLSVLLSSMAPELASGEFVFVSVRDVQDLPHLDPLASVVEPEGVSLVLTRAQADEAGLHYDFVAAWITLRVHSSLHAVGLTAAVSKALADVGMSCNVIAGFHHDHLLVPHQRAEEALGLLSGWGPAHAQ